MIQHCHQRNKKYDQCREQKGRDGKAGIIRKYFEPLMHKEVRHRECNEAGNGDEQDEILRYQWYDLHHPGAENFANAQFFLALFGSECDQAEETKTGN